MRSSGGKLLFDGVNLSVAIILFEGSLGLKLREVRDLGRPIFQLCTVTAGLAWVLITGAAMALGFDGRVSLLLGAILIVTGPTVINPILRQLRPTRRVSALLRWEGIVVDPLGAILALLVYQAITSIDGSSIGQGVLNLGLTLLVGLLFAGPIGWIVTAMMRRHLIPDFLQGVIFVGVAVGTCVGANVIREESAWSPLRCSASTWRTSATSSLSPSSSSRNTCRCSSLASCSSCLQDA